MTTANELPGFDGCIDMYLTAYEQHGTEPFTPDRLDLDLAADEYQRLLELAVAYGLLEFDGTSYNVRCEPDAPADRWQSVVTARMTRIQRAIPDRAGTDERSDAGDTEELTYDGGSFAGVFVTESDDFDAVADTVASVPDDYDGIVLRSPAALANEVQRFADRLCDQSEVSETPLSVPFEKESSDVVGDDKDDLEFRLVLNPV